MEIRVMSYLSKEELGGGLKTGAQWLMWKVLAYKKGRVPRNYFRWPPLRPLANTQTITPAKQKMTLTQ